MKVFSFLSMALWWFSVGENSWVGPQWISLKWTFLVNDSQLSVNRLVSLLLGSRLRNYWPTKWLKNRWWSQPTSAEQTHISCVTSASPGLKLKGRTWRVESPVLSYRKSLIWAAKSLMERATLGVNPTFVMPAQPTPDECYHKQASKLVVNNCLKFFF